MRSRGEVTEETPVLESFVTQEMVLKLVARRAKDALSTSARTLMREWELSEAATCGHLRRLWRDRLIEATTRRVPRYGYRLAPGGRLSELRFRLTERGRERLRWYRQQRQAGDKEEGWLW
jgi:hypothetical protein